MEEELSRRDRKKKITREKIIDTAQTLFIKNGYEQTTIGEIAETADLSIATVFKHFPSGKETLVFENPNYTYNTVAALLEYLKNIRNLKDFFNKMTQFFKIRNPFDINSSEKENKIFILVSTTPSLRDYARKEWEKCEKPVLDFLQQKINLPTGLESETLIHLIFQIPDMANSEIISKNVEMLEIVMNNLYEGWKNRLTVS